MYTTGTGSEVYLAFENTVPFSLSPGAGRRAALINPRHAYTARVTVVVVCVCLSVRFVTSHFTSHQSLHKQYQVYQVVYIQRRMKVEMYVGFSLKLLRLRVMV